MKNLILIATLLATMNSFASERNDKAIFDSLKVKAVNSDHSGAIGGPFTQVKSIGGLVCSEVNLPGWPTRVEYSCALDNDNNAKKIYEALNLVEVNLYPDNLGGLTLGKDIGGLKCTKSQAVTYPKSKPTYSCELED